MERTVTRYAENNRVTETIVQAVADVNHVAPREVEPPLYDVVDPDALAALFSAARNDTGRDGGYVQFTIDGVEVIVHASGKVVVAPREDADSGDPNAPW